MDFCRQGVDEAAVTIGLRGRASVSLGTSPVRSLLGETGDSPGVHAILSQAPGYPVLRVDEVLPGTHRPGACIPAPVTHGPARGLDVPNVSWSPWAIGPTGENATHSSIYALLSFASHGDTVLRAGQVPRSSCLF